MQVCNHRLKGLTARNEADKARLKRVETRLEILSTSNVQPEDSYRAMMQQLEENLRNLTLKKRKFRSLEKGITSSMERVQGKIDNIKSKVLVSESFS